MRRGLFLFCCCFFFLSAGWGISLSVCACAHQLWMVPCYGCKCHKFNNHNNTYIFILCNLRLPAKVQGQPNGWGCSAALDEVALYVFVCVCLCVFTMRLPCTGNSWLQLLQSHYGKGNGLWYKICELLIRKFTQHIKLTFAALTLLVIAAQHIPYALFL